jgi:AGCS family alanine or glycine:cation symporter
LTFCFSEIAAKRISQSPRFINSIRRLGVFITAFGISCSLAGIDLGNLWSISDLGNILIVFTNVPLLLIGAKYVLRATRHYKTNDGTPFTSATIGLKELLWWDTKNESECHKQHPDSFLF